MKRIKLFCCLTLLGIVAALSNTALAQTLGGPEHMLKVKHSGKCVDVAWFSMANEGDIVQSHCTGTDNQIWKEYMGSITTPKIFVAKHSGKAMDVKNKSTFHAADVVQYDYHGFWGPDARYSQMWTTVYAKTENGIPYYKLVNFRSGLCLDVAWFSQADGGNVLQANCTGTDNQLWQIINLP
jgi:hypothetical protein